MIQHTDLSYGPKAQDRLDHTVDPTAAGAHAALESFYYALNQRDETALRKDWTDHPLAQLNNPLGGSLRGGEAIGELYRKIFAGKVLVQVSFGDVTEYLDDQHAVFAGRETGTYTIDGADPVALEIRTTRYFRYHDGRWQQYHHHGSIDDPDALRAYQQAVIG